MTVLRAKPCLHEAVAPVSLPSGEVVASVCEDCLTRLPASWGCEDCEYVETRALGCAGSTRVVGRPCEQHRP